MSAMRMHKTRGGLPMGLLCLASCLFSCAGLSSCAAGGAGAIRLVSWNVQTFFDAKRDGGEYKDFVGSKNWGEAAYCERLRRLCDSLAVLDADVLVLQELENEAVLQDIGNFLCSKCLFNKQYRWAAFARQDGSAQGCAVLSRWPLDGLSCHGIDVRSPLRPGRVGLRPLMQLRVTKRGRSFFLLVNHWKSMSGGREASELWRSGQEALLAACLKGLRGLPAVACGDFNRDITDFAAGGPGMVVLRAGEGGGVAVRSPWFLPDGGLAGPGSYYYKEEWSRIDNFFFSGGIVEEDFRAETEGPWCYADTKIPKKYQVWNGRGYSDHLPLSCTLRF